MTRDFSTYSKEELINIIRGYEEGPYAMGYMVIKEKIEEILREFRDSNIDTRGIEDKQFTNFLAITKILPDIYDNLDTLQKRIDPTILEHMRKESIKPKVGTPEYFVKNK